ncbi:hypothetical protein PG990_014504 [Apiospora arundinis]
MQLSNLIVLAGLAAHVAATPLTTVNDSSVAVNNRAINIDNVETDPPGDDSSSNVCVTVIVNVNNGGRDRPRCPRRHNRWRRWSDDRHDRYECCM